MDIAQWGIDIQERFYRLETASSPEEIAPQGPSNLTSAAWLTEITKNHGVVNNREAMTACANKDM